MKFLKKIFTTETKEENKIFCLFLPFRSYEDGEPDYPRRLRATAFYKSYPDLIAAYCNTPCPASQTIEAKDEKDFAKKLEIWNKRFDDQEWLEENLYPYL